MSNSRLQYLSQIASFLKVQGGKINLNEDSQPTRVASKNTSVGYLGIILQLIKESSINVNFEGATLKEKAEVRQWIEYASVYGLEAVTSIHGFRILKELNAVLTTRTYLVSHRLTIADIFLYYVLSSLMANLSISSKETHLNLCRWYDNLQQNSTIRQSNQIVDFSTNYLASFAPARH